MMSACYASHNSCATKRGMKTPYKGLDDKRRQFSDQIKTKSEVCYQNMNEIYPIRGQKRKKKKIMGHSRRTSS